MKFEPNRSIIQVRNSLSRGPSRWKTVKRRSSVLSLRVRFSRFLILAFRILDAVIRVISVVPPPRPCVFPILFKKNFRRRNFGVRPFLRVTPPRESRDPDDRLPGACRHAHAVYTRTA